MKIVHISEVRGIGGHQVFVLGIAEAQKVAGHEVTVVLPPGVPTSAQGQALPETSVEIRDWAPTAFSSADVFHSWGGLGPHGEQAAALKRRHQSTPMILTYLGTSAGAWFALARWRRIGWYRVMVINWKQMRRERFEAQVADRVVPSSHKVMRELRSLYRVPAEKMGVVGGGCRPPTTMSSRAAAREALGLPQQGMFIAFVGRDDPIKGFDRVAGCIRRLRQEINGLYLVTAPARTAPVEDGILGIDLPRHRMGELYSAADVLVSASRYEGYGLAIHEAMAHGLPVIIPDSAGIADRCVDGENALVVPRWRRFDARLFESMGRLATDEPLRRRLGEAARVWALKNTWTDVAAELFTIYAQTAKRLDRGKAS